MASRKRKKATQRTTIRSKTAAFDVEWVVGLVAGQLRAKSFEVAHARGGDGKLLCGRSRTVRWAGHKKRKIVSYARPAEYERHCRRCLDVLYPFVGRQRVRRRRSKR